MDEADNSVGDGGRMNGGEPGVVKGGIGLIGRIGLIGLVGWCADGADGYGLGVAFGPLAEVSLAEEVFVVEEEFVEAGAEDVDHVQFGLARGGGGATGFS